MCGWQAFADKRQTFLFRKVFVDLQKQYTVGNYTVGNFGKLR
jgi:hypothetical protein